MAMTSTHCLPTYLPTYLGQRIFQTINPLNHIDGQRHEHIAVLPHERHSGDVDGRLFAVF